MSSVAGAIITMLVGVAAIGATVAGTYANYVKVGLRWPLIMSGLVLIGVGAASLVLVRKGNHGHHDHGSERIGALLIVFVVALALAPPALGAAAAADRIPNRVALTEAPVPTGLRATDETAVPQSQVQEDPPTDVDELVSLPSTEPVGAEKNPDSASTNEVVVDVGVGTEQAEDTSEAAAPDDERAEPLEPARDQPVAGEVSGEAQEDGVAAEAGEAAYPISMYDFIGFTHFAPEDVSDVLFEFVGFAADEPDIDGGFRLTRYLMSCCAADAFPLQITLVDPSFMPEPDQWVRAEATWHGEFTAINEWGEGVPVLVVHALTPIDPPRDPYES